jgi:hypothetical protein
VLCCPDNWVDQAISSAEIIFAHPQYRAKNDITNAIAGGFFSGAILARASGPKAMLGGGAAFAAFSGAIDLYLRKAPSEWVARPCPWWRLQNESVAD